VSAGFGPSDVAAPTTLSDDIPGVVAELGDSSRSRWASASGTSGSRPPRAFPPAPCRVSTRRCGPAASADRTRSNTTGPGPRSSGRTPGPRSIGGSPRDRPGGQACRFARGGPAEPAHPGQPFPVSAAPVTAMAMARRTLRRPNGRTPFIRMDRAGRSARTSGPSHRRGWPPATPGGSWPLRSTSGTRLRKARPLSRAVPRSSF